MPKKLTTKEAITRLKKAHTDETGYCPYGYSEFLYKNGKEKGKIYCKKCKKSFFQRYVYHLEGRGCRTCGILKMSESITKWNQETIPPEAKKYNTKTDFLNGSRGAYMAARRLGILDEVCAHMEPLGNKFNRAVYALLFPDGAVYYGLTDNLKKREAAHRIRGTAYEYSQKTGLNFKMITLSDYIPVKEAEELEQILIADKTWAKRWGFTILNIRKGGERGGSDLTHTKEAVLESAREAFKAGMSIKQWSKANGGMESHARRNGYYSEVQEIFQTVPHTKEAVLESAREAFKAGMSIKQWCNANSGMASHAHRNGYYSEIQAIFKPNTKPVLCLNTGKVYKNASVAAKDLSLNKSSISMVLKVKLTQVKGYKFKYV